MNFKLRSIILNFVYKKILRSKIIIHLLIFLVIVLAVSDPSIQNQISSHLGLKSNQSSLENIVISGKTYERSIVKKIIDGDTILLQDGRQVRYLNIDTPETKKPNTPVQCYGSEASEFNKSQVDSKKVLLLADKQNIDIYGRYLRFVFIDELDVSKIQNSINFVMIERGFARSLIIKPNNTYQEVFLNANMEAKASGVGVWSCEKPFIQ